MTTKRAPALWVSTSRLRWLNEVLQKSIDMTIDAIKEIRDRTPFKPFVIGTADGNGFEVPNHDCLLVAEEGRTLIVVTADQKFHILATELVSSITR